MGAFLRHPLVVVVVAAAIAIGFYYYASPYEKCIRWTANNTDADVSIPVTAEICAKWTNW